MENKKLSWKVIMADVDMTICESCQIISDDMANIIDKLIEQGTTFVFISGTDTQHLRDMLYKIKGEYYILGTQGTKAMLVNGNKEKIIYSNKLTDEEKNEIILAFENLISNYNIKPFTSTEDQLQDRESQITLSAIGRHAPRELKANYDTDCSKRIEWKLFMENLLDMEKYDISIGGTTSLDVTKKGWDKGKGVELFCNTFKLDTKDIIYFGDKLIPGGNDYPVTRVIKECVLVNNPYDTLLRFRQIFMQNIY